LNDKLPALITGCPRSGTRYIQQVLKLACGMDIYHENPRGKDGIVDWHYTVPQIPKDKFKTILHQVRNPLDVINSLCTISRESQQFISETLVPRDDYDTPILRAMRIWYIWCCTAETIAVYTYRVENVENELESICGFLGVTCDMDVFKTISKQTNSRKILPTYGCITWDDIKNEHSVLHGYIVEKALDYGYTVKR
jgi:hypothetical protein